MKGFLGPTRVTARLLSIATALTISAVSGLAGYAAFVRMNEEESQNSTALADLEKGPNEYALIGQTSNGCFGAVTLTLLDDNQHFTIDVKAALRLKLPKESFVQKAQGTVSFNPLGQLGGSAITFHTGGMDIGFGTLNVNPITLKVVQQGNNGRVLFEQNVPGPIEIKQNGNRYTLTGPTFGKLLPSITTSAATPALIPFKLGKVESGWCDHQVPLELDVADLAHKVQLLKNLLPSNFGGFTL